MSNATLQTATNRTTPSRGDARFDIPATSIHKIEADGVRLELRQALEMIAPGTALREGIESILHAKLMIGTDSNTRFPSG